jgi:predicted MFS family arabinose efflux permease
MSVTAEYLLRGYALTLDGNGGAPPRAFVAGAVVSCIMRSAIWIGIFIGSTIGGLIPLLWGDDMLSYSGVLFSGLGAFVGLWLGSRASR